MNFAIDGILMTLLVGTVAALCIASFLFLFLHKQLRIPAIDRLFRVVLYEDSFYRDEADRPATANTESVFAGLLLIATLFGMGVGAEYASERFNNDYPAVRDIIGIRSDKDIRADAFRRVAGSEVRSGRDLPNLRALYTDQIACSVIDLSDGDPISPCSQLRERIDDFYYTAKNVVFTDDNYYTELSDLQARIDFMRSLGYAFVGLALILAAGGVAAFAAELADYAVTHNRTGIIPPGARSWWQRRSRGANSTIGHIKNLSALRLFILALLAGGFGWFALSSWETVESAYDSRVYGYYVCPGCLGGETIAADSPAAAASLGDRIKGSIPRSPFHLMSSPDARFEPSAVAFLGTGDRSGQLVVIANDKNSAAPLALFRSDGASRLEHLRNLPLPGQPDGLKIEAIALAPMTDDRRPGYLAGSRWIDGKETSVILAFDLVHFDDPAAMAIPRVTDVPADGLCAALGDDHCRIEALAIDPARPGRLLVGMRSVGVAQQPGLHIVSLDTATGAMRVLANLGFPKHKGVPLCSGAKPRAALGLSDMVVDGDTLLLLASFEAGDACPAPPPRGKGPALQINAVQGSLWRLPLADLDGAGKIAPKLVTRMAHKPEGLALSPLENGTVLLVFDDDTRRKGMDFVPQTFALRQSESVFAMLRLP